MLDIPTLFPGISHCLFEFSVSLKIAAEKSAAVAVERVPSSAGLSDAYTDATTDDERNELWSQPKTYSLSYSDCNCQ